MGPPLDSLGIVPLHPLKIQPESLHAELPAWMHGAAFYSIRSFNFGSREAAAIIVVRRSSNRPAGVPYCNNTRNDL